MLNKNVVKRLSLLIYKLHRQFVHSFILAAQGLYSAAVVSSFFLPLPHLFSAVTDCMSTIFPQMMWP